MMGPAFGASGGNGRRETAWMDCSLPVLDVGGAGLGDSACGSLVCGSNPNPERRFSCRHSRWPGLQASSTSIFDCWAIRRGRLQCRHGGARSMTAHLVGPAVAWPSSLPEVSGRGCRRGEGGCAVSGGGRPVTLPPMRPFQAAYGPGGPGAARRGTILRGERRIKPLLWVGSRRFESRRG